MEKYYFDDQRRAQRASSKNFVMLTFLASGIVGLTFGILIFIYLTYGNFSPLQKFYFRQFAKSYVSKAVFSRGKYRILMFQSIDEKTKKKNWVACVESHLVAKTDENGNVLYDQNKNPAFLIKNEIPYEKDSYTFYPEPIEHRWVYDFFSRNIYESDFLEFFYLSGGCGVVSFAFVFVGMVGLRRKRFKKILEGKYLRGTRILSPKQYASETKNQADGFGIKVLSVKYSPALEKILKKFKPQKQTMLRVRRADEGQGGLLLGDTGTGKTLLLQQAIYQARAAERQEPGVCYDPAGEFAQVHFREKIDLILNPLDARFPNWQLRWEIENALDADLVAESFFATQHISEQQKFFNRAAKGIFKMLLETRVSNQRMIETLSDENLIDELVKGTELAHKISAKAGPQRAAVLGTLADVADALRLLPAHDPEKKNLSLSHWVKNKGQGWLFLTTTLDTRDALRPLQAAMLNILLLRLMSAPSATGKIIPFWLIADELHSLHTLSALPTFIYESRKFGAKYLFGTQNKHQIGKYYGQEANAMLASAALKIFLRCNEPDTARWISDNIGEQERSMPFTSTSVDAGDSGRVSTNYSNRTEKKVVVSKEQIMQLPNLHGYWCFDGKVVPFELPYTDWRKKYPAFIQRREKFPAPATAPQSAERTVSGEPHAVSRAVAVEPSSSPSENAVASKESEPEIDLNF